ncbi:MAG TPA: oxygen-independent coproporphyrinogen III oxidase [Gemmatimonadales bacterium]|nr:oxygen-independent coproporphyrinogen III oxidase [Gemmatimonadales bacterium]
MPALEPIAPELVERYDRAGPRYTSYPPVPAWTQPFGEPEYLAALGAIARRPDRPLSLYVHLPFCATRCFYCGCNATVTKRAEVVDAYLDRLERELDLVLMALDRRHPVVQMHWGGGTPNFLDGEQLARLMRLVEGGFAFAPGAERSIELDPRLATREQLATLRRLGFNRVSLGVQDLDPDVQLAIGRVQSLGLVADVVEEIRALGFDSLNLDLIYGLPRQTLPRFRAMLETILELRPDRVAAFGYAHMPAMRANQRRIHESDLPTGYDKFHLFEAVVTEFTGAGYQWIGLDHFARPDDELAVAAREKRLHRNFMGYTIQPSADLLGLGTSAIGDLAGRFVQMDPGLGGYQRTLDGGRLPVVKGHHLSPEDQARRSAILHLMCNLELPFGFELDGGDRLGELLADDLARFAPHVEAGLVEIEPDRIAVTPTGRFFLRNLCMELDAYLPHGEARVYSRTV